MSAATALSPDGLDLNRLRGDFTRVYNPVNPVEQMLVEQIAMSWQRLTRAQAAEYRYFSVNDILEAISKKPQEYKAITRYVADCERAWRHAVLHIERMQRQRLRGRDSKPAPKPEPVRQPVTPVRDSVLGGAATNLAETQPVVARAG